MFMSGLFTVHHKHNSHLIMLADSSVSQLNISPKWITWTSSIQYGRAWSISHPLLRQKKLAIKKIKLLSIGFHWFPLVFSTAITPRATAPVFWRLPDGQLGLQPHAVPLSLYFSLSLSLFLTSRSRSTLINLRACQRLPSASAAPRVQFLWASTRRLTELPCCSSNTQLLITHRTPRGVIKNQGYKGLIAARWMHFATLLGSRVSQEEDMHSLKGLLPFVYNVMLTGLVNLWCVLAVYYYAFAGSAQNQHYSQIETNSVNSCICKM